MTLLKHSRCEKKQNFCFVSEPFSVHKLVMYELFYNPRAKLYDSVIYTSNEWPKGKK